MDRLLGKLGALGIAAALVTASTMPVRAATLEPAEDGQRGKELFDNGRRLFDEGSYDAAISAFDQAYAITKNPNLLYNIHLAYEKKGDFDKAIEYLDQYRALAPSEEQDELVRARESLQIRKERAASEAAAAAAAEAANEPAPEEEPADEPPPPSSVAEPTSDTGAASTEDIKVFGAGPIVATSIAVVAAAAGVGLGLSANNQKDAAEEACSNDLCLDSFDNDATSSRRFALGANVSFGVAGAAALIAVTLVVVNSRRRARSEQARVLPAGPGVRVRF